MKNLCTTAVFFLLGLTTLNGQQQKTSAMRVTYQAGSIPASEAIERFLEENKFKQFAYSRESLKDYRIRPVKCTNESVLNCLAKILKGLPFEALIYENTKNPF
ncbi:MULTISPECIES: hypothetical protein [Chryseobacterium]|uniref:Secretin/TonB short N-terminal domain-containing protein n=1 Tax=Chryseobacterium camelliae TaxID=1265445 RepID=A0ABU0TN64_9FLAO|nr:MULTISPECIES: hypothetical protein [Chryseobacterium]MDQ1097668.1 hypothetical protein [Chryseobacterium camelliae]MDQ1101597.1 hypothetical protein [Chryseobacterium sp. SORGH_AS_1048]MDR6085040.1 hypothetical protein [Chryseobacterium sp. SORGH_AS_0909]MDR6129395.1 hypothetical protein [Chryseobacterium sp. SORGH_AS_1175]